MWFIFLSKQKRGKALLLNLQVGRGHIRKEFGELFDDSRCILVVTKLLEHLDTQFKITSRHLKGLVDLAQWLWSCIRSA